MSPVPLVGAPELAALMRADYAAMEAGDPDAVEALYSLAPGSVFIGSDQDEYWTDSAQHNADVRPYWQPGTVHIDPGDIVASRAGDVGFTVDRPTLTVGDERLSLRITLVWQREADGAWRVVHSHASVGQASPEPYS